MVRWEHCYLLGTMVFTIAGDVVRDFDEEYEAWSWLEQEGWGLVAIEPPDPVRPGVSKYYFKRQKLQSSHAANSIGTRAVESGRVDLYSRKSGQDTRSPGWRSIPRMGSFFARRG